MRLPDRVRSARWGRALVAIILHRPGLWLLYRVKVSETIRKRNRIAAFAVTLGMAATAVFAPKECRFFTVFAVWAVGHLVWGIYLAAVT